MYVQLTERVGYVPGGTNIGIVRADSDDVILIDSGLNDTTARKVLRVVRDELQANVVAIINTHGHADHFGANAFVQKRTQCEVWAPAIEAAVIAHPILQPALLYGGADPMDALRNKFLLAEPSTVTGEIQPGLQTLHGCEFDVIPMPGHSPNQVGLRFDGVLFCADVLFPEVAIEKYRIPYLYGLTEHLYTIETVANESATAFVPGHGAHTSDVTNLVSLNRGAIERTIEAIVDVLSTPMSGDDLAAVLFQRLEVPITDAQSYYLLRPTISAYLAHLARQDVLQFTVEGGRALWSRL